MSFLLNLTGLGLFIFLTFKGLQAIAYDFAIPPGSETLSEAVERMPLNQAVTSADFERPTSFDAPEEELLPAVPVLAAAVGAREPLAPERDRPRVVTLFDNAQGTDRPSITRGDDGSRIVLEAGFVPTTAEETDLDLARLQERYRVDASSLRLRSGPGTGYDVVDTLSAGTIVTHLGNESDEWLQVATGRADTIGWMHRGYLSKID